MEVADIFGEFAYHLLLSHIQSVGMIQPSFVGQIYYAYKQTWWSGLLFFVLKINYHTYELLKFDSNIQVYKLETRTNIKF
jgi:hypothetical protein